MLVKLDGNNKMEKGCCAYGFDNKARLKNAEKYFDFGVNTLATMVLDVTDSIENNESRGFYIQPVLNSKIDVKRIIPMRLTESKVALLATGIEWEDLKNPFGAVNHIKGWEKYSKDVQKRILSRPYSQRGNNNFIANYIHSDFKMLKALWDRFLPIVRLRV